MRRIRKYHNLKDALPQADKRFLFIDLYQLVVWPAGASTPQYALPAALEDQIKCISEENEALSTEVIVYSSDPRFSGNFWEAQNRIQLNGIKPIIKKLVASLEKNSKQYKISWPGSLTKDQFDLWICKAFPYQLVTPIKTSDGKLLTFEAISQLTQIICISSNPILFYRLKTVANKCNLSITNGDATPLKIDFALYSPLGLDDGININDGHHDACATTKKKSKKNKNMKPHFAEGSNLTVFHRFDSDAPTHPTSAFAEESPCTLM